MSGLELTLVVGLSVWLLILTLVSILVVRQIGLLTVRLDVAIQMGGYSPFTDGLDIGESVPTEVIERLPELRNAQAYLVLISSTCSPCRDLVAELNGEPFDGKRVIALLTGRAELADPLETLLPFGFEVIRDPDATKVARALELQTTPFAIEVNEGQVSGKAFLRKASDLIDLLNAKTDGLVYEGSEAMDFSEHAGAQVRIGDL